MPTTPPAPRSRLRPLGALALVAVLAAGAFGLWYLFGRPAPAEVGLGTPSPAPTATASVTAEPGTTTGPGTTPGGNGGEAGLDGTWTVDPSVGSFADFSNSFVGYRVREELVGIGATEAVGRTPDVAGTVTVVDGVVTEGSFAADLTTLRSDETRRDGQLRTQALETNRFPDATFTLTAPFEVGALATGETVTGSLLGDLTLHGVTRFVELEFQARLADGVVTVVASTEIVFADFGIAQPRAMIVLSVADRGTLELQLHLRRS